MKPLKLFVIVFVVVSVVGGFLAFVLDDADRGCRTVQHETGKTC
jgi:hypothetical protein